jgi:HlyD family secretion protein
MLSSRQTLAHPPDVAGALGLDASPVRARVRRWLVWALVLLGAAALAWWALRARGGAPTIEYRTEAVRRGPLVVTVTATGALEPLTQVNVGTEISGIVESVAVDDNDRVRAGQVLATLNTDKLRAQLAQSRASRAAADARLQQARASLADAERELARLEDMYKRSQGQLPARRDIDQARTAVERAQGDVASAAAGVTQAAAAVSALQIDLGKATIRSPIDGIVLDRQVDPGQTVAASFQTPTLFTLARDLNQMRLSVGVDEADIGTVSAGQTATFTVDAYPDRRFTSAVVQIGSLPETVSGVVTYEAQLRVENPELLLRPGMTATAEITVTRIDDALLLPNAALRFVPPDTRPEPTNDRGFVGSLMPGPPGRGRGAARSNAETTRPERVVQQRVWVLQDGAPAPVTITTGVSDGAWTVVRDGPLTEGSQVIVDYVTRGSS